MSHKVKVTVGGQEYSYFAGKSLKDISRDFQDSYPHRIIVARVDGKLTELSHTVESDCELQFITTGDHIGNQVYQRSCRMIMIKAFEDVVGKEKIDKLHIMYAAGDGLYCELESEVELTEELIEKVKQKMHDIVEENIDFVKRTVPMEELVDIYTEYGLQDKVDLLYYKRGGAGIYYMLDDTIDCLYGFMAPDTSYIDRFDLKIHDTGFVLQLPNENSPEEVKPVNLPRRLYKVFKQSKDWGRLMNISNIADLNRVISDGQFPELVLIQEALMEKNIADIASRIQESEKRVILIAGPSSSGKTSFSHRLSIQMRALGLKPHPIAVDNYFVDRDKTPKDEDGNFDFECLQALDLKRLNNDLTKLLKGKEVQMPVFNFVTGKREDKGEFKKIGEQDVLVIEGIHSLNDEMTYMLDPESKYKIYISALTHLSIDDHNRIPTTDVRLIRRMCRDAAHRGASASKTLSMWRSVRRGEEKNIFPFQEECNYMFNSAFIYELAVLKQEVEPLLFKVRPNEEGYDEAQRLLKFMTYILGGGRESIPNNSIIREFIGGSCFDVG